MKIPRFGIALGLAAGLGGCSDMMGNMGSTHATSAMAAPTVAPDMVRQVQSKLRDAGYYKQGAVDGVWGASTEASVRSFQRDHNLSANGQLDVPTLQALNVVPGPATSATNNPLPAQPNDNPAPAANAQGDTPQH